MAHVLSENLRAAVLQAAMQGKLTDQLSVEQINIEKAIDIKEPSFEVPNNWIVVELGSVVNIRSASRVHQSDWRKEGVPFYRAREVVKLAKNGYVDNELFIDESLYEYHRKKGGVPNPGDLLVSGVGTLGAAYVVKDTDRFYYKDASVLCFERNINIDPLFMKYVLETPYMIAQIYDESAYGTTVATLTMKRANKFEFALPPIQEQHRIVARVEELMAKIDEYEKLENQLAELKAMFPGEMKNAVLQAAMEGKLTKQLPEDGNAETLLNQIKDEKARLISEKKIKKEKALDSLSDDDVPFAIPKNWEWVKLGKIISLLSGQDLPANDYNSNEEGVVYLTGASNIDENGEIIINRWTKHPKAIAHYGDLLLSCKGTVGKTTILDLDEVHIARQFMALTPIAFSVEYLQVFILSYVDELKKKAKSMIPGIERQNVLNALIPLPPIEEQNRIVEKLDALLPLCDELAELA